MKQKLTIKELCLMAVMSALGMVAKPIFSPIFNMLTDFIKIPGGSMTAGVSMLFLVFMTAYTGKMWTATLMGFTQAFIALSSGISSIVGVLVFVTYTLPGAAIDLIMCTPLFSGMSMKERSMFAGAFGVFTGAFMTNLLYFRLALVPFVLFYFFGMLSGAVGGYFAYLLQVRFQTLMRRKIQ